MNIANIAIIACIIIAVIGCADDSTGPITGHINGLVLNAVTKDPLSGVQILVFNANTNAPVGTSHSTGVNGMYSIELPPGSYCLKFSKLGYDDVPPTGISPVPINVTAGRTANYSVEMITSDIINGGSISGRVIYNGAGFAGALVTAGDTAAGYSSVTDGAGYFHIYNVPPGSYTVQAWYSGYASGDTIVTIITGTKIDNIRITLSPGSSGVVKGKITFLATTNIEVDVALVHPLTRQTIPGLSSMTVSQTYMIQNVPAGKYLARATYANDGKVVDPDWIIKNGEPFITVSNDTIESDFSVTGAVELLSPTNPSNSTQPFEISDSVPLFSWVPYSSAEDYVVEVINQNGKVIWGGFENDWSARKVITTDTQIRFNNDATATEQLLPGRIYKWKIYASKDDHREPYGWKLISASEDQMGIIKFIK